MITLMLLLIRRTLWLTMHKAVKILLSRYSLIWVGWTNRSSRKKYHLIIMYSFNSKMGRQRAAKMIMALVSGVKINLLNSSWHRITFERVSRSQSLWIREWLITTLGLAFNLFKTRHRCPLSTSKRSSLIYQVRLEIITPILCLECTYDIVKEVAK